MAAGLLALSASPAAAQGLGASLQACLDAGSILFSTEVDFLTLGPVPPDGNPIVSDGDLLGTVPGLESRVCARNADLLASFGTAPDLGLDAVDVVGEGEDTVVFFSTELDGPAEIVEIRAGDLLATTGAVIPNAVLLQHFDVDHDVGLDAVHGIGDPRSLIAFWQSAAQITREEWLGEPELLLDLLGAEDVDLWISTEGTAPSPATPAWLDGDVLSVRTGNVVLRNADALPPEVPAGLPSRGVDFGLDAVAAGRVGQVDPLVFSVEVSRFAEPALGEADLLGRLLGWRIPGVDLTFGFEAKSSPLGLDALSLPVPEPGLGAGLSAGIGLLAALGRRRRRRERDVRSDARHAAPTADRSTLVHRKWRRPMLIGAGILAGSIPCAGLVPIAAAGTVVSFGGATPPGSYDAVTPGGAFGPELDLPEATIDGGVRLTNYQPREDRLDDSVYATSDFSTLSDGSGLPGEITVDFTTPVRAVRVSIQDWYLAAPFRLEGRASDDSLLASDTVSLEVFTTDPGDAGRLTVVADEITRIVISSLQVPGEIDFAIDNLTYESGPVFTQDTPDDAVVIPAKLPVTLSGSSRFVTTSGDEPLCNCGTATDGAPVWLRFAPGSTGPYSLDTSGSSYDTVVSVWRADDLLSESPPIEVACDDDSGAGFASMVDFQAEGGVEYRVLVTEYERDIGGDLVVLVPEPDWTTSAGAALLTTAGIAGLRPRRGAPRRAGRAHRTDRRSAASLRGP
jgi:hypothetical protein